MEEPLALHPVKLYVYDLSKGMARRLSPLMLGKSTAGAPTPPRPPPPGGSRSATGRSGPALPRRETGPKSPPPAPGVAIPTRYRSPEGAARRGRLPQGTLGGGGVRRAQYGLGCVGLARGPGAWEHGGVWLQDSCRRCLRGELCQCGRSSCSGSSLFSPIRPLPLRERYLLTAD